MLILCVFSLESQQVSVTTMFTCYSPLPHFLLRSLNHVPALLSSDHP